MQTEIVNGWWLAAARCEEYARAVPFAGDVLSFTEPTAVAAASGSNGEVVVLGFCVDSEGDIQKAEVARWLADRTADEFPRAVARLGGCFVVFRAGKDGIRSIWGDATHTVPIYYAKDADGRTVAGSHEKAIADMLGLPESPSFRKMYGGEYATDSVTVGDVTLYEGVRCLLPNHHLDLDAGTPVRHFPFEDLALYRTDGEIEAAIDRTIRRACEILRIAAAGTPIAVPLTAGFDSRTVAALVKNTPMPTPPVYFTFLLKGMRRDDFDLKVAKEVAAGLGLDYRVCEAEEPPEALREHFEKTFGETRKWDGTFEHIYLKNFPGRLRLNGSLADQIGKASIGYSLPDWTASALYLMTKHRNVSWRTYPLIRAWRREAKAGARGYPIYDLWSWELCLGRWSSDDFSTHGTAGLREVNVFNCANILNDWCKIPRKIRVTKILHRRIMEKLAPEMLAYPFNPHKKALDFFRDIRLTLYFGAWAKFVRAIFGKRKNRVEWKVPVA